MVDAECWLDKTPLSAQTYPSISESNTDVDIFSPRKDGALIGRVSIPLVIIYGDKDIGIEKIDGDVDTWKKTVSRVINDKTKIEIIKGANHGFSGHEDILAEISNNYIQNFLE